MTDKQPEALRLARELEGIYPVNAQDQEAAAAELRRLHLYASGADQLVEVWKERAQDFMNSRDRLMKANRSLLAKLDSLRSDLSQPAVCGQWIYEYPGDVFVVFDPMTDGAGIVGAARTLREAGEILDAVWHEPPAAAELRRLHEENEALKSELRMEQAISFRRQMQEYAAQRDELMEAMKLALEYWKHRQKRYKNRSPAWVESASYAIAKAEGKNQ